ncbi:hypothetical protein FRC09_020502, partial [Ceratobasidium sp. 395]
VARILVSSRSPRFSTTTSSMATIPSSWVLRSATLARSRPLLVSTSSPSLPTSWKSSRTRTTRWRSVSSPKPLQPALPSRKYPTSTTSQSSAGLSSPSRWRSRSFTRVSTNSPRTVRRSRTSSGRKSRR